MLHTTRTIAPTPPPTPPPPPPPQHMGLQQHLTLPPPLPPFFNLIISAIVEDALITLATSISLHFTSLYLTQIERNRPSNQSHAEQKVTRSDSMIQKRRHNNNNNNSRTNERMKRVDERDDAAAKFKTKSRSNSFLFMATLRAFHLFNWRIGVATTRARKNHATQHSHSHSHSATWTVASAITK